MKREDLLLKVRLEKLRVEREKAAFVLNKALIIYFVFLAVAVIGFINGYIKVKYLNILIVMGFIVLIVGVFPYISVSRQQKRKLQELETELK